jgi:hypothetical protein
MPRLPRLNALLLLAAAPGTALAQGLASAGPVTFADGTPCYYRNPFFGKDVRLSVNFSEEGPGNPPYASRFGGYPGLQATFLTGSDTMEFRCDEHLYLVPVTIPTPSKDFVLPALALPNSPPVAGGLVARFHGQDVDGVPPGSTVELSVAAVDPDGDPLHYLWAANEGRIASVDAPVTRWTLPDHGGLHFAYVLVNDGKGGYREVSITLSTDGGVVPAAVKAAPPPQPSDRVPASDQFLTYFSTRERHAYDQRGTDSKMSACQYYRAIGAVRGCRPDGALVEPTVDFGEWKRRWGFHRRERRHGNEVAARYANARDLNLQRDMHGTWNAQGTAYYVCNYPNPASDLQLDNVIEGRNLVACVAMEYSVTPGANGGKPFTKFLTFGPGGELFQSVNLDGRGEKFMPGACVVCHGASSSFTRFAENGSTPPDLGASFLPFDLDNFQFSTRPGFRRADLEASLRMLNQLVLTTGPNATTQELVAGWYPTPASAFDGTFVPVGWTAAGQQALYRTVVKPSCRTCHVAMGADVLQGGDLAFGTFAGFADKADEVATVVCGDGLARKAYTMPNSKVTFDHFWNDPAEVAALVQFLNAFGPSSPASCPAP